MYLFRGVACDVKGVENTRVCFRRNHWVWGGKRVENTRVCFRKNHWVCEKRERLE